MSITYRTFRQLPLWKVRLLASRDKKLSGPRPPTLQIKAAALHTCLLGGGLRADPRYYFIKCIGPDLSE